MSPKYCLSINGLSGDKHRTQASPLTIHLSLRKVMINAVYYVARKHIQNIYLSSTKWFVTRNSTLPLATLVCTGSLSIDIFFLKEHN